MAVLTDGQMIVGDGSTDPVAESGATLRTSIGVGTTDSVLFTNITASGAISASGDIFANNLTLIGDFTSTSATAQFTNITASGGITTTDLIVENNVSGSGTIELAKKVKGSANRDQGDFTFSLTTTLAPNGCLLFLDLDNGTGGSKDVTFSLPAVATSLGRHVTMLVQNGSNSHCELAITAPSTLLQGMIINSDSNEVVANKTTITIGTSDTDRGDRIDLFCDGVYWYITFFRQGVAADTTIA